MSSSYTCPPLPRVPVQGTRVTADTIIDSVVYVHQEVIANIESEMECKILCLVSSSCTFYTYFLATDTLYHQYCFLLTKLVGQAQPCPTCNPGPRDCSNNTSGCSLAPDGEEQQAVMVTSDQC